MTNDITVPLNDPFLQVAAETQQSELGGRLLKFSKGKYYCGDDEIAIGGEYIAHVATLLHGYVKFVDSKLIEQKLGKVADDFRLPKREELGDTDESAWERDATGAPRDPWAKQFYLPLENIASGEVLVYVTSSRGGSSAIGNLCSLYARNSINGLPVIRLGVSSYRHRTFGRIDTPDLKVLRWTGKSGNGGEPDDDLVQVVNPADDMNDSIPF
jgi:hypothetical protein